MYLVLCHRPRIETTLATYKVNLPTHPVEVLHCTASDEADDLLPGLDAGAASSKTSIPKGKTPEDLTTKQGRRYPMATTSL